MKKFNRDSYLKKLKLKRNWQRFSKYFCVGIPCVLCLVLGIYFAYSKFFVSKEQSVVRTTVGDFIYGDVVINAYIDGEYSSTIPGKNDGYVVDKVSCDNGAVGKWNNDKWGLLTTNLSKRTKCNVYFKKVVSKVSDIIAQLDTSGKCPTVNDDGSVSVTGVEATNGYLCKAKDAYGDSYYYRGNVTNNYVKFANFYWRIVRINGDGTVRVIYDGTAAHANGESSRDRQIGTSEFNNDNHDNAYVGYMYGDRTSIVEPTSQYSTTSFTNTNTYYIAKEYTYNASTNRFTLKDPIAVLGSDLTSSHVGYYTLRSTSASSSGSYVYKIFSITAGSSSASVGYGYVTYGTTSKEAAQTNKNDSTIKTYLDNWYKTNIVGTTNEQYLADNIFCNDRSFSTLNSGTGAGMSKTYYRLYNFTNYSNNNKIMLTCPQQNDAFTVSDTTNGNGALTYPVGLLSTDEIALAGGWNTVNSGYYLYSGQHWWASSPSTFNGGYAGVRDVYSDGLANDASDVRLDDGVRPVFNLKPEVLKYGDGTASNPYRLTESLKSYEGEGGETGGFE